MIMSDPSPLLLMKAIKNPIEREGMRQSHVSCLFFVHPLLLEVVFSLYISYCWKLSFLCTFAIV